MNETELRKCTVAFARVEPGFMAWRLKFAESMAGTNDTSPEVEDAELLSTWLRALEGCGYDEALEVIGAAERGQETPTYGQWARWLKSEIMQRREVKRQAEESDRENAPRYHCPDCRDQGIVTIVNPYFVRDYKEAFIATAREGFPLGWLKKLTIEFRKEDRGPIVLSVICDCDCRRSCIQREELAKWGAGQRARPPAGGAMSWRRDVMPKLVSGDVAITLDEFYGLGFLTREDKTESTDLKGEANG